MGRWLRIAGLRSGLIDRMSQALSSLPAHRPFGSSLHNSFDFLYRSWESARSRSGTLSRLIWGTSSSARAKHSQSLFSTCRRTAVESNKPSTKSRYKNTTLPFSLLNRVRLRKLRTISLSTQSLRVEEAEKSVYVCVSPLYPVFFIRTFFRGIRCGRGQWTAIFFFGNSLFWKGAWSSARESVIRVRTLVCALTQTHILN